MTSKPTSLKRHFQNNRSASSTASSTASGYHDQATKSQHFSQSQTTFIHDLIEYLLQTQHDPVVTKAIHLGYCSQSQLLVQHRHLAHTSLTLLNH